MERYMPQLERFAERYEIVPEQLRRWLVEAMVLGAAADGEIDQRETDEIALVVSTQPHFEQIEPGELSALLRTAVEGLRRDGFVPRVYAMAGALPRYAHRVLAFRAAARVAMAKSQINGDEIGLLREMQDVFGITEPDVARAIEDAQGSGSYVPNELEPIEAYLDCLLMGASADGEIDDSELATIIAFILERPVLAALDGDLLHDYIRRNGVRFSKEEARVQRIAELADELPFAEHRENAWGLAFAIVTASGSICESERVFLEQLEEALDMETTRSVLAGDFGGGE